jgi:hypothetical protein
VINIPNVTTVKKYHVSQDELRKFLNIPPEYKIDKLVIGDPKDTRGKTEKSWLIVIAKEGDANDEAY